ncbi:helix-turn-helix domain-containing protein [Enterococcus devriesei]|uniref:HTH cro/C1-type domain-containing protein n=1 Tax=Enterococcus devriesei TaxID=319970 RepID=A0A1L8SL39_9ENTE|nr:helix-turn-helix transcriptional regulator [Enterococcus devriesei]OJG32634.1 hypothetical protein RV00_GL001549 [Enterococcus devriesei]
MIDSEKEMKDLAICLSRNLVLCMCYGKPIKNNELSKKSGVSLAVITRIKNDWQGKEKVQLETVVKLAAALNVEAVDLLSKNSIYQKLEGTA